MTGSKFQGGKNPQLRGTETNGRRGKNEKKEKKKKKRCSSLGSNSRNLDNTFSLNTFPADQTDLIFPVRGRISFARSTTVLHTTYLEGFPDLVGSGLVVVRGRVEMIERLLRPHSLANDNLCQALYCETALKRCQRLLQQYVN